MWLTRLAFTAIVKSATNSSNLLNKESRRSLILRDFQFKEVVPPVPKESLCSFY
jgi:hypothetical protein